MKRLKWGIVGVLMVVAAAGCGYHLAGGGYLNGTVSRVAVDVFENKSSESRAGIRFTNELIQEITAKSDTQVVDEATRVMSGTVKSITFSTLSRSTSTSVVERRVIAVVDVALTDSQGGILWSVKDFLAKESYATDDDAQAEDANKGQAVDIIAQRVAERLVGQMLSGF